MKTYYYPQNLKAKAQLWLWSLRDFLILSLSVLLSAVLLIHSGILLPAALSLAFGIVTIRLEDTTVMDFCSHAVKFFLTSQQYYEWR
jgi:hypothetical protein